MKTSELITFLLSLDSDKEIVTGESWLPEQLVNASLDGEFVNLQFDNAPEEDAGEFEARGFVEHEVNLLRDKIVQLLFDQTLSAKTKSDLLVKLVILAHEKNSSEVVELLEENKHLEQVS